LTLFSLLLQTFSKGIIFLSFKVNRDFISKNLCIQKAASDNCCKGSCQLKKQLRDDERKSDTAPFQNLKDKLETILFCESAAPLFIALSSNINSCLFNYSFPVSFSEKTILHPPPQA
jgi:hypothetical protein